MANAEQFASAQTESGASASQTIADKIGAFFLVRADIRRTEMAVRELSDHVKRDIGLNVAPNTRSDFDAELRRIRSHYAW